MQDYTDHLAAVENSLRRIIERVGHDIHGDQWLSILAKPDRIKLWERNREREDTTRVGGIQEKRLIYFSDFKDLIQIITTNWMLFEPVFIDQTQTTVYLEKLRELRNPDAHRRELTEGEKHLIIGMASDLRTKITRYMATKDTPDEYFPRMESMKDSLGHTDRSKRPVIRVGDMLEFVVEAWDPEGKSVEFEWSIVKSSGRILVVQEWSLNNRFTWHVKEDQIGNPTHIYVRMRGTQNHHAQGNYDDHKTMTYTVLPMR